MSAAPRCDKLESLKNGRTVMATALKVIISCGVSGAIHTPS